MDCQLIDLLVHVQLELNLQRSSVTLGAPVGLCLPAGDERRLPASRCVARPVWRLIGWLESPSGLGILMQISSSHSRPVCSSPPVTRLPFVPLSCPSSFHFPTCPSRRRLSLGPFGLFHPASTRVFSLCILCPLYLSGWNIATLLMIRPSGAFSEAGVRGGLASS